MAMQGSRLCLIDTDSRRGDFLAAEARKESAEGHAPTLKYFALEVTPLLFTVHCPEPLAYPNVTSREAGRHRNASGIWKVLIVFGIIINGLFNKVVSDREPEIYWMEAESRESWRAKLPCLH